MKQEQQEKQELLKYLKLIAKELKAIKQGLETSNISPEEKEGIRNIVELEKKKLLEKLVIAKLPQN